MPSTTMPRFVLRQRRREPDITKVLHPKKNSACWKLRVSYGRVIGGKACTETTFSSHVPIEGYGWHFSPQLSREALWRSSSLHSQDVEKSLQLCSRIAQRLNVPQRVRFASSLAAAALEGLFEHPMFPPMSSC